MMDRKLRQCLPIEKLAFLIAWLLAVLGCWWLAVAAAGWLWRLAAGLVLLRNECCFWRYAGDVVVTLFWALQVRLERYK